MNATATRPLQRHPWVLRWAAPPAGLSREATLLDWLRAHALARGRLDGLYQRDWRGRSITPSPP